jgi:hypothetical protein
MDLILSDENSALGYKYFNLILNFKEKDLNEIKRKHICHL